MRKYFIVGALIASSGFAANSETPIPTTLQSTNKTLVETQVLAVDIYVSGDISMSQSELFYVPPTGSVLRYSLSDIEQSICLQVGMMATSSQRSAVPYSTLIGKSILYAKNFNRFDALKWIKGRRPSLDQVTVPEDADLFFAELKSEILTRWHLPIHPTNLDEVKDHLVLGHITSVICQRAVVAQ